jgi:hypothetical protein
VCELVNGEARDAITSEADMRAKMAFTKVSGEVEIFKAEG